MTFDRFRPASRVPLLLALIMAPGTAAQGSSLDEYCLFGVKGDSADLVCYDFAADQYTHVGTIRSSTGQLFTGIEGTAAVPHNQNIFGFWADPADNLTKLVYISCLDATAAVVGQDLGPGSVTGATVAFWDEGQGGPSNEAFGPNDPTPLSVLREQRLFAVQAVEAEEDDDIDFEIDDGKVVPSEPFAARVTVLGAAISYGSQYDMHVTTRCTAGSQTFTPFGDPASAVAGNVNDNNNPRHYIPPNIFPAGTPVTVYGKSWKKKKSWYSGTKEWHWTGYMSADSVTGTPQIIVLRDGDAVPDIEPFLNQGAITEFVIDYIDQTTNTMKLDENQAIYLFELGTSNLASSAADFQDLVVLVTLASDPADLEDPDDDDPDDGPSARLVKVDPKTGGFVQLMTLDNVYDGLASDGSGRFHATSGQQMWLLDPANQTETQVGSMQYDQVKGLEFADTSLHGFTVVNDRLVPFDATTGATVGNVLDIQAANLTSILFTRTADLPVPKSMD